MALEKINVGTAPNDGAGDNNRAAWQKVNAAIDAIEGKLNANDPSVTNAREWTASVVSQAEAESSTFSTPRKWTSQRVWQAINAWWQLVSSGFGRNFVQASNAAAARNTLELGTAATADVTTSSKDTTAGRVMKVGDGGLLGVSTPLITNLASHRIGGSFHCDAAPGMAAGLPFNLIYLIDYIPGSTANSGVMYAYPSTPNEETSRRIFRRSLSQGVWHPWREVALTDSLGTAAAADVTTSTTDSTTGRVLKVGDFGLGGRTSLLPELTLDYAIGDTVTGLYEVTASVSGKPSGVVDGHVICFRRGVTGGEAQLLLPDTGGASVQGLYYRARTIAGWPSFRKAYDSFNTTVDSNGFLKAASPIINLYADKIIKNESLEISNVEFTKISTGKYQLNNCPALSSDGWYLEQPRDRNGGVYHNVEWYYENGKLTIETFQRVFNSTSGEFENGQPVDIEQGRFISLRFEEDPELYAEEHCSQEVTDEQ